MNDRQFVLGKRLLLGMGAGVLVAGFVWGVVGAGGSVVWWLLTGGLLGLSYAGLFRPIAGGHIVQLSQGMVVGVGVWGVFILNVYPLLAGHAPLWQVGAVASSLPWLIACLLMGGFTGPLYGLVFGWLDEFLQLSPSGQAIATPDIKMRVVILGGGYAGVAAAQMLEKELAREPTVGIWLVSNTNYLLHTPMLSEVAASAVDARNISPPLRSAFHRVQVVHSNVERVDLAECRIYLAADARGVQRHLAFDHLIVATGSVPHFFGNPGLEQNSFTFKTLEDALRLRHQVIAMFERADLDEDRARRQSMMTFVVAGGGFAGVELIGALNDFARGISVYYPNIDPDEIRVVLVHSGETILPELSIELGRYAQEVLEMRGVEFRLKTRVTGAEPGRVLLAGDAIATETFVWTAGNQPSPLVEQLGVPLTQRGLLEVNRYLASVSTPGLWAAGDCAQIPDPYSRTGFAPPTAQHAVREGKVVGYNVAAAIRNRPLKQFNFKMLGSLSALGHQLAVAELFGYRISGFLAWLIWRSIYLAKLPTLERRLRVGLDWLMDIFFPPDIVQVIEFSRERKQ